MNYRIVAYPPTESMQAAAYDVRCPATAEYISRINDIMLAASPQPDTVLTAEERRDVRKKTVEGIDDYKNNIIITTHWTLVARAIEAAVLKKLRGEM